MKSDPCHKTFTTNCDENIPLSRLARGFQTLSLSQGITGRSQNHEPYFPSGDIAHTSVNWPSSSGIINSLNTG